MEDFSSVRREKNFRFMGGTAYEGLSDGVILLEGSYCCGRNVFEASLRRWRFDQKKLI